ncbi:hypothetical protein H072_2612 [Dactylellina haptotyla CBS 200.50]|uniref:Uncharacterized protein n=1 Tax=Dactylellina haptotyla (strain CBS 200.50) TaxID=1284197 RepID=S8AKB4_DACHA|nr:hypothetical protein H072_2612 [Dactylellina haptotyla CBS 200.50]
MAPVAGLLALAFYVTQIYKLAPASRIIPDIQLSISENSQQSKGSFYFDPPEPSIKHSVVRGDGVVWTMDNHTLWRSVGRHPSRPECWTYKDRFGAYENASPEMSAAISTNNKAGNKKAMILRLGPGQVWRSQFVTYVRSLVIEAGYLAGYDIIIYIHLDLTGTEKKTWLSRIPQEFKPLVQTFSTQDLKRWLPKNTPFKNVYESNHTPIQMFMAKNENYDFVYSVEGDVRLIGRWDTFLADVDNEYSFHCKHQQQDQDMPEIPDLLSFQVIRRPRVQWPWFEKADACLKRFGGKENTRSSVGPVWGWSRRLLDAMTEYNKDGINCYFEYFAPTIAYQQNLTSFFYQHPIYCPTTTGPERHTLELVDLGKNDPRLVQLEKVAVGCSYFFVDVRSKPFWGDWYDNPEVCRPQALVHPVKDLRFN